MAEVETGGRKSESGKANAGEEKVRRNGGLPDSDSDDSSSSDDESAGELFGGEQNKSNSRSSVSSKQNRKTSRRRAASSASSSSSSQQRRHRNSSRADSSSDGSISPHRHDQQRPRFDSQSSWADSTRFDQVDSRRSSITSKDIRLSSLSNRPRSDSRSSRYSRASSSSSSSSYSKFDRKMNSKNARRGSKALSTITESWNTLDGQFSSPFADMDAQEQPIREQLQKHLDFVNSHSTKLKDIEDAITGAMSESDPIQLHFQPPEKVDVQDLIRTDNELFNKVLTVFAVLCDEISELKVTAVNNFFPALIMFGQARHGQDNVVVQPGEDELHMGRMLPFFQDVSNFVDRCNAITINVLHQLASLYDPSQKLWKSTFRLVHLRPVFDSLACLLEVLITLDAIVIDNPNISTAWDKYKRMMQYVRADPKRYHLSVDQVKQFERLLVSLDQTIMGAQVFQGCIEQDFQTTSFFYEDEEAEESVEQKDNKIDLRGNHVFLEEFLFNIKDRFSECDNLLGTGMETNERQELVGTLGLYVLYRRLTPPSVEPDFEFYRSLWESQSKVPCITLCGKVIWYSAEFLMKYAPMSSGGRGGANNKLEPSDVGEFRRQYLHQLVKSFPLTIQLAQAELSQWLVRMESFFQPIITTNILDEQPDQVSRFIGLRSSLILKGLNLSGRIQTLMHTLVNLHVSLGVPMQKRVVQPLYQSIEMLKSIEFMFARKNPIVAESTALIRQQLTQQLQNVIRPIKAHIEASSRFDDTKLDILAALTITQDILDSGCSFSSTRLTVLSLALRIALISDSTSSITMNVSNNEAMKLCWKLSCLSDFNSFIRHHCDCSFFYWSRELLHTFLSDIYERPPEQCKRIQYVLSGFCDAVGLLNGAQHEEKNEPYVEAYANFLKSVCEEELVDPICKDIENDLRLHIHSVHLDHMQAPNPRSESFKVLHYYLDLRPLRLIGCSLDVRQRVTHYLESIFYNLTTVALHDWKTYGEMKNLANEKYGLALAENHLPMGSLDQGLDILQIMRNIHIFVARYNYNLNQQFFLERRTDKGARHLNSINIHSIASSIRTHGMGIMNTTVNVTYKFLCAKFDIFSQFLFDEYIKSHLQQQRRWFKKNKESAEVNNQYPYEKAFAFNKEVRKLGVSDQGKSFLDQFRTLITQIGNALGYVRMVRSAGMNYCSNAIKFVPNLNSDQFSFEKCAGKGVEAEVNEDGKIIKEAIVGAQLSEETVSAARNVDDVILTLSKNFSENNDYLNLLVTIFQDVMINDEQKHLKNFYQIIPALTINFAEASVQAKDLMYKNSRRRDSYFSDDGFAIGIAYILAILKQGEEFDALHWFDEVVQKYEQDAADHLAKQQERETRKHNQASRNEQETTAELIDDEEEVHTLQLTAKRIEQHRREFDLLNWSLNGARIFFKD